MKLHLKYKYPRNSQVVIKDDYKYKGKDFFVAEESGITIIVSNDNKKHLDYVVRYTVVDRVNQPLWNRISGTCSYEHFNEDKLDILCTPDDDRSETEVDVDVRFSIGTKVLATVVNENAWTGEQFSRNIEEGTIIGYEIEFHRKIDDFYKIRYKVKIENQEGWCNAEELAFLPDDKKRNYKKI